MLLAAVCFARSSRRLHRWFTGTRLYRENLGSYLQGQGMTWKTKIRVMVTVTLLMSVGFVQMHRVLAGQVMLTAVWGFHILYFLFGVKTRRDTPAE